MPTNGGVGELSRLTKSKRGFTFVSNTAIGSRASCSSPLSVYRHPLLLVSTITFPVSLLSAVAVGENVKHVTQLLLRTSTKCFVRVSIDKNQRRRGIPACKCLRYLMARFRTHGHAHVVPTQSSHLRLIASDKCPMTHCVSSHEVHLCCVCTSPVYCSTCSSVRVSYRSHSPPQTPNQSADRPREATYLQGSGSDGHASNIIISWTEPPESRSLDDRSRSGPVVRTASSSQLAATPTTPSLTDAGSHSTRLAA